MSKTLATLSVSVGVDGARDAHPSFIFRPIHYLGSKLRVLASIEQAIDSLDPTGGPVCDLFSGSATVSRSLSSRRQVLAVDIQEYARVLAGAVLNGDSTLSLAKVEKALADDRRGILLRWAVAPLVEYEVEAAREAMCGDVEPLCDVLELGNLASVNAGQLQAPTRLAAVLRETLDRVNGLDVPGADTVCIRHFGGQYFSFAQAADLDAIASLAREQGNQTLLAATLSAASQLVNSIGKQFAQPIRPRDKSGVPKVHVVKKILLERGRSSRSVFMDCLRQYHNLTFNRRDHVAVRADFREVLKAPAIKPSIVYADPPYTRDHYSRFYHSLETIALGDDPGITMSNLGGGDVLSRGGYRSGRHQSPFCIKSKAPAAFSSLFAGVAALEVPLVLSYSGFDPRSQARPRVMGLEEVVSLARKYFGDVQVELLTNVEHMKLNTASLNKAGKGTTEVLILCR